MVRNILLSAQAQYAAEGGIALAVAKLLTPSAAAWRTDGAVQQWQIGNAEVRVAIYDEAGRIDLNYASAQLLDNLLEATGVEADERMLLVDAIMDWRDGDNFRRLNGAEDDDYSAAGLPYGAKDSRFDAVDELGLVMGLRPEILQAIRPALTVYSRQAGVNPAVASALVLQALSSGNSDAVDAYIEQRRAGVGGPMNAAPEFIDRGMVSTARGSIYTIHVESRVDETIVARVAATVALSSGRAPYTILSWRHPMEVLIADDATIRTDTYLDQEGGDTNE